MPLASDHDKGKRETFAVIAARYGVTERTAKRWAAHGKEHGEVPPFQDPAAMIAWWSRWMVQRAPSGLMEALAKVPKILDPVPLAVIPAVETISAPSNQTVSEDVGLEAELSRLEWLARTLSSKAHEPGQAKAYLDTVARMTALTKQMREEAERMKKLLPKDLVEAAIHEFHGPIEREVRLLYKTMCDVTGLPPSPENENRWHKEIDKLFARFAEAVLAA